MMVQQSKSLMKRGKISRGIFSDLGRASGWLLLLLVLIRGLPPQDVAVVFATLLFAELLSNLLCDVSLGTVKSSARFSTAVTRLFWGWLLICGLVLLGVRMELSPFFATSSYAAFCFLGLILTFGLLSLGQKLQTKRSAIWAVTSRFRIFCFACILALIGQVDRLNAATSLSGIVLLSLFLLLLMLVAMLQSEPDLEVLQAVEKPSVTTRVMQEVDILILPWILPASEALLYLLAKGVAQLSPVVLHHIAASTEAKFHRLFAGAKQDSFIALAARLNLGAVLVGGSLSIAAVLAGPQLAGLIELSGPPLQVILLWLVLGAAAPVFFGCTDLFLKSVGLGRHLSALNIVASIVFVLVVFSSHASDLIYVAQVYAAVVLFRSAMSAAILAGTVGVWPGLTALVLRQIKLL